MRISRPGSSPSASGVKKAGPAAGGAGFEVARNAGAAASPVAPVAASGGAGGAGAVSGVDALMALQGVSPVGDRRDRALRKGRRMLDALDRLHLSVLDGDTSAAHLGLLRRALEDAREATDDDGLDDALAHVEVRAAVEIAKLERSRES